MHGYLYVYRLLCSCVTFIHLFRSHKSATVYHYYIGVVCLFYLSHSWSYILLSFPCLLVVVVRALGLDFILYFISPAFCPHSLGCKLIIFPSLCARHAEKCLTLCTQEKKGKLFSEQLGILFHQLGLASLLWIFTSFVFLILLKKLNIFHCIYSLIMKPIVNIMDSCNMPVEGGFKENSIY